MSDAAPPAQTPMPSPGDPDSKGQPTRKVHPLDEPFRWPGMAGLFRGGLNALMALMFAIDRRSNRVLTHLGSMVSFTARGFQWAVVGLLSTFGLVRSKAFPSSHILEHAHSAGVKSFGIIALVAMLVGLTMVLQTIIVLESYGQRSMVAGIVGVTMARELGPLITAIIFTGRVGAAWTAELGTMKVQEEILALETMGINPIAYLVAPRIIAAIVVVPCLTMLSIFIGIFAAYMLGVYHFELNGQEYLELTRKFVQQRDIVFSMFKALVFAVLVAGISCYKGFVVEGGGEEVGRATMEAVVIALVLVIFSDTILVMIFNLTRDW